ncbi:MULTISPECIES: type II toxin-antitoxin system VapC family toxin [Mumia]|uniref:type II toxin-antitoxin system VapC family toxin n=1 Tax=Mumia TaxID=1546255 RepID=UPI0014219CF7|nr:type II toxin-antitoxin system VapC family toxin [Mumia sp. ZJ430]
MFVLDASAALGLLFDDEDGEVAEVAFRTGQRAVVPPLFLQEVSNAVAVAVRRGRLARDDAPEVLARLTRLPIHVSPAIPHGQVLLELALALEISSYDATYLALALGEEIPLVTADQALSRAAASLDVSLTP